MHSLLNRVNKVSLTLFLYVFMSSFFLMATSYQLDNFNHNAQTVDVMYDFDEGNVAGFQFVMSGISINGASGGSAEEAGFSSSTGNNTVLGFSFSGAVIPAGNALLTNLSFYGITGEDICLSDAVISDPSGNCLSSEDFCGMNLLI